MKSTSHSTLVLSMKRKTQFVCNNRMDEAVAAEARGAVYYSQYLHLSSLFFLLFNMARINDTRERNKNFDAKVHIDSTRFLSVE